MISIDQKWCEIFWRNKSRKNILWD